MNQENNGFGPISKPRGNKATIASVVFTVVANSVVFFYRHNNDLPLFQHVEDFGFCFAVISSLILGELLRRVAIFTEESNHIETRYNGDNRKVAEACFKFPEDVNIIVFFMFLFSSAFTIHYWLNSKSNMYPWPVYLSVALISCMVRQMLNIKSMSDAEISEQNETQNHHVADGLAWSYYFGYLKLILPGLHDMISGAQGRDWSINNEDTRKKISVSKVFIIIPKNCYCYESFTEVDDRITFVQALPPQRIHRGGVQERVYKNSLYKIQLKDKDPIYVIMEYATPLLTIYDMAKDAQCAVDEDDVGGQAVEFYKKLKFICEKNPQCNEKFELVLIDYVCGTLADVMYKEVQKCKDKF